jgi:hypothetical protein
LFNKCTQNLNKTTPHYIDTYYITMLYRTFYHSWVTSHHSSIIVCCVALLYVQGEGGALLLRNPNSKSTPYSPSRLKVISSISNPSVLTLSLQ